MNHIYNTSGNAEKYVCAWLKLDEYLILVKVFCWLQNKGNSRLGYFEKRCSELYVVHFLTFSSPEMAKKYNKQFGIWHHTCATELLLNTLRNDDECKRIFYSSFAWKLRFPKTNSEWNWRQKSDKEYECFWRKQVRVVTKHLTSLVFFTYC